MFKESDLLTTYNMAAGTLVHGIDWSRLRHARGVAADIPAAGNHPVAGKGPVDRKPLAVDNSDRDIAVVRTASLPQPLTAPSVSFS